MGGHPEQKTQSCPGGSCFHRLLSAGNSPRACTPFSLGLSKSPRTIQVRLWSKTHSLGTVMFQVSTDVRALPFVTHSPSSPGTETGPGFTSPSTTPTAQCFAGMERFSPARWFHHSFYWLMSSVAQHPETPHSGEGGAKALLVQLPCREHSQHLL